MSEKKKRGWYDLSNGLRAMLIFVAVVSLFGLGYLLGAWVADDCSVTRKEFMGCMIFAASIYVLALIALLGERPDDSPWY